MSGSFSTEFENFQMTHNIQISNLEVQEELAAQRPTAAKMLNWQMRAKFFLGMTFLKWF